MVENAKKYLFKKDLAQQALTISFYVHDVIIPAVHPKQPQRGS